MNPLRIVIDRKVLIGMFFIAITMLGVFSYRRLSMEIYPNSELPTIVVTVSARNETTPSYLEREAVLPLEGAIGRLEGVEEIETTVEQRRGTITVTYGADVNMKYATLKMEEAVETVRASFEDEDEFTVSVQKVDTERLVNVFMGLQVRGSGGLERVRAIIDNKITPALEAVNGVASVSVTGGRTKSVEITLNDETCDALGITASSVSSILSQNTADKLFVGQAWDGSRRYFVNLAADYTDVRNLENLVVKTDGPIHLRDIATVTFGTKEATSISRVNGLDAVTIQLTRDSQSNMIDLARNVRTVVKQLNTELAPNDVEIVVQTDTAADMEDNLNLIKELALSGALLAMAVLWLFLRNFRLVSVIVLAIPISVLAAFNFFYAFGITINTLTLVGIALAVGMLLDNGVVVLENIMRLLAAHRGRDTAVLQGTAEVWRSIAASTLTTIIVFLPFVFASDYAIRLIGHHIGISIISTLLISLLTALFLTPMLTHALLGRKQETTGSFATISYRERPLQIYTLLLKSAMRYPARTILGAVGLFLFTLVLAVSLSLNISREVQLTEFPVYLTAPTGSTLETSDRLTTELEARLKDIPEKQDVISRITEDGAQVTVKLREDYEKIGKRNIPQIKADIEKRIDRFTGATVSLSEPRSGQYSGSGGGGTSGLPLEQAFGIGQQQERILVKGNDSELLRTVANNLRYYIEQLETVSSVSLNVSDNSPEVHIVFDRDRMAEEDIGLSTVSRALSSFGREVSTSVAFKQGTEEYDIVIKSSEDAEDDEEEDKTADDLRELPVTTTSGASYELGQLSSLVFTRGQSSIHRLNQERQVEVTYRFEDEVNESKPALQEARDQIDQIIEGLSIPAGVAVEVKHSETDMSEFYFLIGAAFTIIYMLLASVFESFSAPFVMMFTIPLAAIGALGALVLTGNSLMNASSLLGFLILLGVVVNNGILLIDYTRILRTRGFRRERALMTAGRARLRPILITSITTVIGMIPLAMGKSEYVSMIGAPFAIAVVGGLSMSTLFTLVLIPTVYSGMESAFEWFRSLNWKLKLAQAVALIGVALVINATAESTLWKFVYWTISLVLVPAIFAFLTVSLRRAGNGLIPRGDALHLHIQRVVKTYDADGRFLREWKKGERLDALFGANRENNSSRDVTLMAWVGPLLAFFVYFTYFYLGNAVWTFVFAHAAYICALAFWSISGRYLAHRFGKIRGIPLDGVFRRGMTVLVWGLPAVSLAAFHLKGFLPAPLAFIAIVWYGALTIRASSNRYHAGGFNLARLTGRLAGIRKAYYETILAIPVLGRRKQPFQALDGVSLEITSGMFGLLGPNGAGKTTIMRIICGILEQSMGTMRINGIDFRDRREELQGLIGYLPQEFGTYENLTAREFLDYIAILKGIGNLDRRREIVEQVLAGVHLAENGGTRIGSFSGGMKQRVGIAMTLLHLPRILVVDEPTAGLDPRERIRFRNLLVELSRERIVIFSTHIIEDISSSCNRVAVLNRGHLSYLGSPLEMTEAVRGKVWEIHADEKTFAGLRDQLRIVHHMRIGNRIRVRCLSEQPPVPEAEPAIPTLEDAYLWLLGEHKDASGATTKYEPGTPS